MVIRGRTRGNGRQLADYLLKTADNDNVLVLGIRGTSQPDSVKYSLIEMSLTSELTKSSKGLYHVQINPAIGEDKKMTADDWCKAADILEAEAGFTNQKRVIVLHEKKNRIHAHVVWERYDHDTGIMISDSFNRLAQDRARQEMERVFNHQLTPVRNDRRPEMKQHLTSLWQQTKGSADFMKEANAAGYQICQGTQRPFMVVDDTGRSFDLVRQLTGIRTKDVRDRLKDLLLVGEKQAIHAVRIRQNAQRLDERQQLAEDRIEAFADEQKQKKTNRAVYKSMLSNAELITGSNKETKQVAEVVKQFQENNPAHETPQDLRKRKIKEFKEQFLQTLKEKKRSQDNELEL